MEFIRTVILRVLGENAHEQPFNPALVSQYLPLGAEQYYRN